MNSKQLTLTVAALVGGVCANAGILITESLTPTTMALTLNWTPESPNPEATAGGDAFWAWDVTFDKGLTAVGMVTAKFNGTHLIPAGQTFSTTLSVPVVGFGFDGDGALLDDGDSYDSWTASMFRNAAFLPLALSVGAVHTPIPEASDFALLGGLGLLGFGAYRRFRAA
jgi:hypothetical protein